MWGLSFVHTGFLIAGAAAAAAPILIHLLMRQRARQMPIGSVRFLKSVLRQHTRRKRIRQWLLLALRTLAILLLALLFARPFFSRSSEEGINRQVIVLVDRSASMQAADGLRGTAFDKARQIARRELARLDEQTAINIGWFDASGVEGVDLAELDKANRPSKMATDYGAALGWARDLIVSSTRPSQQVILITDLQRSGMDRTPLESFPETAEVLVHDVGRAMNQNLSIEDASPANTEIRPKEPVTVIVRVVNGGAMVARDVPVELVLKGPEGPIRREKRVTLLGGARETIEFSLDELTADGIYEGSVGLTARDDLQFDNRRWLAFEARHPDRLLLVDGQEGRTVYTNETYYLETALRLRSPTGDGPSRSFEVERLVWEDGDGFPSLEGFRAIVLCNIGRFSDTDARRLREYVEQGGNVLMFAGDQTSPSMIDRLRSVDLMSLQLAADPVSGLFRCRKWDEQHPVFTPFKDPQNGDLRRLAFARLLEVSDLGPDCRTLIHAGPYPLMVEQSTGQGTMILVTSTADRAWSDWPQSRLYVPFTRQLLAYLTNQLGDRQAVRWELIEDAADNVGIIQVEGVRTVRNVDPRESLLDRVSEEDFRETYGIAELSAERRAGDLKLPEGVRRPNEMWSGLMWILLLVLSVETLFASRVHA